ncbi:Is centromere binding protein at prophase [Ceratocystis lukuohia]|uniref:Is centromere binding protein at prophase n=1 Tax=Ceratocystis lukuohia TaxID=2019550 RepID=A0ABR4MM25_9PEZI
MATLGDAIVAFARDGRFPSEDESAIPLSQADIGPAITALKTAKKNLEADIHAINEETRDDVGSWVRNARSLQEDIIRSQAMAKDIIRDAENPGKASQAVEECEAKAKFLTLEVQYAQQLHGVLRSIKHVNGLLDEVDKKKDMRSIADALRLLDESTAAIEKIPVNWLCRPKRLLEVRAHDLKTQIHEVLGSVWKELVVTDVDSNKFTILQDDGAQLSFIDVLLGLQQFNEVDEHMDQLWHDLDAAILSPRMDIDQWAFHSIQIQGDTLFFNGETDNSAVALLTDLGEFFKFLSQKLPSDALEILCSKFVADLIKNLIDNWLVPAVPPSVQDIGQFDDIIHHTKVLCEVLSMNGISDFDVLSQWVRDASGVWLAKCRETTLDSVRFKLTSGLGSPKPTERIRKILQQPEAEPEPESDKSVDDSGWDSAWIDDEAGDAKVKETPGVLDDGADAWGWDEDEGTTESSKEMATEKDTGTGADLDDAADAWGWGDEDDSPVQEKPKTASASRKPPTISAAPIPNKTPPREKAAPVEVVTREKCSISSMPEPVLQLVFSILEDGAAVTQLDEDNLISSAAPGLFAIPALALSLFRAISPYYYSLASSGNMFLYNDALYLAEKLYDFSNKWNARQDISAQAKKMLSLDNEVSSLRTFANRAFTNELNIQKTILRDLMGGAYNVMQQGDSEANMESTVARVQMVATEWEAIATRESWCRAVGSLIDAVSSKIISDVMDLQSIGQDDAYEMARIISRVSELDRLFMPSRLAAESAGLQTPVEGEISAIAGHVPSWLRMQFLSEVLQSNLNEVKYLWFESDLSLYFSMDEVVELIGMSFEMNARTQEVLKDIRQKPMPHKA